MDGPIRVVVANQPTLMREMVLETIFGHADIEVVAEIKNKSEIDEVVDGTRPDFVIIALDESDRRPPLCDTLLQRHPGIKILAIAPDRNCCTFFWASLDIHASPVEASEAGILGALRRKGRYATGS
jgi:chemotaxis response regulator CheB